MGKEKKEKPPLPNPVTAEVAGNEKAILVYELLDPIIQNNILYMERAGGVLSDMVPVVREQFDHYVTGLKDQKRRLKAAAGDPKASDKEREAARKALTNVTRWMDQVSRALMAASRVTDEQIRLRQYLTGEPDSRREETLRIEHAQMGEVELMTELFRVVLGLGILCPDCTARLDQQGGGSNGHVRTALPVSRALPEPEAPEAGT